MPTAARLIAALCLCTLGVIVSYQIIPTLPESTDIGYFVYVNALIGVLCGWIVMGKRAGRGRTAAINNGLTGIVTLVFWGLAVQGTNEMVRLAMRNRYDGPFEAIVGIFEEMATYGQFLINPVVIATLLVGGLVSGLLSEYAAKNWR